jgi:CRISPR-associated protein Csc1
MTEAVFLDCHLTLCESVFFASREIDRLYITEALIGNYALAFALGLATSPYRTDRHRPQYAEDLRAAIADGAYVTPAHPVGAARFHVERFNVQTETYWSTYTNGAILYDPTERGKTKPKPYANNRPQQGSLKMLARGMEFRFFVFGVARERVPAYVRIGKFFSKAQVECHEVRAALHPPAANPVTLTGYYNPLDWPEDGRVERCNVVNIHPVPVVQAVAYHGATYRLGAETHVAAGLKFRF